MIVLSFQDFLLSLQKNRKKILFFSCTGAMLFFFYALLKPLSYTATAIYNHSSQNSSQKDPLTKLLGKSGVGSPPGLLYYPVLERCVKKLHLQAELIIPNKEENYSLRKKLKAEALFLSFLSLSPELHAPLAPLLQECRPPVRLSSLLYTSDFMTKLKITFLDEERYEVKTIKGEYLGLGHLDQPFLWNEENFTLTKENKELILSGKEYLLKLLPLATATHKLQKKIRVKKDKLNDSLYHIHTTHLGRHFAAKIINTLLEEYQTYVREKGERCSRSQLHYLDKRKAEAKKEIEAQMGMQKEQIESNISNAEFAFFDQEVEFVNKQQVLLFTKQKKVLEEIKALQEEYEPLEGSLSLEVLQEQILQYQLKIEEFRFEKDLCDNCLLHLNLEGLELPPRLPIATLNPHYTKLEAIQNKLLDQTNYSHKERSLLEDQMKIEKKLFRAALHEVKKSNDHEIASLQEHLDILNRKKISALIDQYESIEKELIHLGKMAKKLPEKWLQNEEVKQSIAMEEGVIKTLSQLVESNNLGEYNSPLYSYPLHFAYPPSLVNPPKLLLFLLIGLFSGAFFTMIFLLLQEAFLGPTCSKENLHHYGYTHLGTLASAPRLANLKKRDEQTLLAIAHHFGQCPTILINQKEIGCLLELLLQKNGCLIDLVNKKIPREGILQYLTGQTKGEIPLIHEAKYDRIVLGYKEVNEEFLLLHNDFIKLLQKLQKEYTQLLILCEKPLSHPLLQKLSLFADKSLFSLTEERMSDLTNFNPQKVLFFTQKISAVPKEDFRPLLDKLYKKVNAKSVLKQYSDLG